MNLSVMDKSAQKRQRLGTCMGCEQNRCSQWSSKASLMWFAGILQNVGVKGGCAGCASQTLTSCPQHNPSLLLNP